MRNQFVEELSRERLELYRFALWAMALLQDPSDTARRQLISAARSAAPTTVEPGEFEQFADWLEQQPAQGDEPT